MKRLKIFVLPLIAAITVIFIGEYISYGKLKKMKEVIVQMGATIQQQGALIKRMVDQDVQKQQELDVARKELNALKTGSSLTVPEK